MVGWICFLFGLGFGLNSVLPHHNAPSYAKKFYKLKRECARSLQKTNETRRFSDEYDIGYSLAESIVDAAHEAGLPLDVAFRLVYTESSFRAGVCSWAGACGLTQVKLSTARDVEPETTPQDLLGVDTNLRIGFAYLNYLIERFDNDTTLAIHAYNGGPTRVRRGWRNHRYVDRILNR